MLEIGTKAPEFTLLDKDGNEVSLKDFLGRKVVLYFYPKDSTPGCTRQAKAFKEQFEEYNKLGAVIIGISKDSTDSHAKFASKYELPFLLLSDPTTTTLKAYEVLKEKSLLAKVSTALGVIRSVYAIDENGVIEAVWGKVNPEQSVLDALEHLQAAKNK